jgi:hypothetical protein
MPSQAWEQALVTAQGDGAALTNTTTATSLLPAQSKLVLPANFFATVGSALRVRATGRISTLVTSPGTLTLDLRFGSTVVANGGTMNLNVTAQTNASWWLDMLLTARAVGASANLMFMGQFTSRGIVGSGTAAAGSAGQVLLPDTAPAVGSNFDSTATQTVDLFATWSVANASNSITLHQFILESLN